MTERPWLKIAGTVFSSRQARELADFYSRLLGWPIRVMLDPDGHPFCLFPTERF